jgi:amino acid transporter
MLVPLIFILILFALITRAAKKFKTSSTIPLLVSLAVYVVFVVLSRHSIRVRPDQFATGLFLGILMYAAVAAIIYGIAIAWMKKQSPQSKDKKSPLDLKD